MVAPNWDLMCSTAGAVVAGPGAFAVCEETYGLALRKGLLNSLYALWPEARQWFGLSNVAVAAASSTADGAVIAGGTRYAANFAMAVNCDDSRATPVARAGVDAPFPCTDARKTKPVPTSEPEPATAPRTVGVALTLRFVVVHCVYFPSDPVCTGGASAPVRGNANLLGNLFSSASRTISSALRSNGGADFLNAMRPALAILQAAAPPGVVPMAAAGSDGSDGAQSDMTIPGEAQVFPPLDEAQAEADAAAAAAAAGSGATADAGSSGLTTGAIAGIAVGAALAVTLLVAGVVVARRARAARGPAPGALQLHSTHPASPGSPGSPGLANPVQGTVTGSATFTNAAFAVAGATAGANGRPLTQSNRGGTSALAQALSRNASAGRRPAALNLAASGDTSRSGTALASPARALAAYRGAGAAGGSGAGGGNGGALAGRRSFVTPKRPSLASAISLATDGDGGGASASV